CSTTAWPSRRNRCSCASLYFSVSAIAFGARGAAPSLMMRRLQPRFVDDAVELFGVAAHAILLRARARRRQRRDDAKLARRHADARSARDRNALAGAELGVRHGMSSEWPA